MCQIKFIIITIIINSGVTFLWCEHFSASRESLGAEVCAEEAL